MLSLKHYSKLLLGLLLAVSVVACEQPAGDAEGGTTDDTLTTPSFTSVSPTSPSNSNTITLNGTGPKKKKIKFYLDPGCTTYVAQVDSTNAGVFSITSNVVSDTAYTFYAKAFDTSGGSSACSSGIDYIEDSTPPATPTSLAINPAAGNNNNPVVSGTTSPDEDLVVYSDAGCNVPIGSGSANNVGAFSFSVPVVDNNSYTLYIKSKDDAGNYSPCTGSLAYLEDSAGPAAPTGLASSPVSPNNSDQPLVTGNAEANSTVQIHTNSACANLVAMGTADGSGNFSIQANVGENTTQWFYARAVDAGGNVGPCSTSNVKYVNDSLSPAITSLTLGSASPYNNNSPSINGSTEGNAAVTIYRDAGCTTSAGTGTSSVGGLFSITVSVTDNTTTNFWAKAIDAAANVGLCTSFFVTFVEDSVPPGAPSSLATNPTSPAGNNYPQITGSAEAGTTIKIYSNSSCTTLEGTNVTDGLGNFAVAATVPNDSTTTFWANATDPAGSTSSCSTSSVAYTHDSGPPAAPTSLSVAPASPSNSLNATINGSAEPSSVVRLYTNGACSSSVVGTGSADGSGNFSIPITVSANSSTSFFAKATDLANNTGACSSSTVTFINDTLPPSAPTGLSVSPPPPANNNSPVVSGAAEANAFVTLYSDGTCSTSVGSGNANTFGIFSITASVADNSTTSFYAKAMDVAGNVGSCSVVYTTYAEDSSAPLVPHTLGVSPTPPANNNNPSITGATEANATVRLYTNSSCTNLVTTSTADGSGNFDITFAVSDDSSATYWAKAFDTANNASACSSSNVAYTEDSTAPSVPASLSTSPVSPANNNNPSIAGFTDPSVEVRVYSDAGCTVLKGTANANGSGIFSIPVTQFDDTSVNYKAKAIDAAGNLSACSGSAISFVEDSTAPAAPSGLASNPVSPVNENNPVITGTTDPSSTVVIYSDSLCSTIKGSGTANGSGVFDVSVVVSDDTITLFYAKSTDPAGNASPCSTSYVNYTEDSSLPGTPNSLSVAPTSPANNNNPTVSGTAEPSATVRIYSNSTCSNLVATGSSDGSGNFGISFAVADNSSATFYARATDGAGNVSPCSVSNVAYVEDSTTPAIPSGLATAPVSPANNNNPSVTGFTDANETVTIYSDVSCSTSRGTGTANGSGIFSIPVTTFDNTTTTFYAKANDAAGNTSACSSSNVVFVEDSATPAAPTALAVTPTSPANNNSPSITGTSEANANISLYTNITCTSSIAGSGAANGSGSFSIAVSVANNSSTTFYAKAADAAGNTSACSTANVAYDEDSSSPAVPSSLAVVPTSPANNNNPTINGTTEAGALVKLYTNASCTSGVAASGNANGSGNFSISLAVSADTSTTFYATAEDTAANVSSCSTSFVTFVEDSTAPAQPLALDVTPASPANNNTPDITGSAEANSSVAVYSDSGCTSLKGTGTANGIGLFTIAVSVTNNTTTTFYAKATDASGNIGACSASNVVYVEDSNAPTIPTSLTVSPTPPANNNNITVGGTTEANALVNVYTDAACSSAIAGSGAANGGGIFAISVAVNDNSSTTFYAKSGDAAGNSSACSISSVAYTEDSSAPAAPTSLAASPLSPANNNSPSINGSTEANANVSLYTNSSCTSGVAGTGAADGSGNFSIGVSVAADSTTAFYAKAADASGNTSSCSSSTVTFIEDSTAPGLPVALDVSPASPANNNSPDITGSAEANSSVAVYSDSGCTVLKGTGSANGIGLFSITIAATNNTTSTLYAKATDAAGNASGCSTSNVVYVEDSTAPATPSGLGVSPTPPQNNNSITLTGNTDANVSVALYTDSSCSSAIAGSGTSNGGGAFSINISVADNSTATYYAKATDAASNASACSISNVTYIEDSSAPAAPTSLAASPLSPANNNSPSINGSTEANASVTLYTNASCTSGVAGTGTADGSGNFSIGVSVTGDTTTTFYAKAADASGNTSSCSSSNVAYVEDSTAPGLPTGLDVSPASPANNNSPDITGSAEANSNVSVYSDSGCTVLKGTGTANGIGLFTITVAVANNATTTFYAKATDAAGNIGSCSTANVVFVEDSTAPATPTTIAVSPTGPANNNNITVSGASDATVAIALYTDSGCTSAIAGSGNTNGSGNFSIAVSVSDNTTTTYYAKATDTAGNGSACSSSNSTYVEDSAAPNAPTALAASPSAAANNNNSPAVSGSTEANASVTIYTNSSCTSAVAGTGTADGSGNFNVTASVTDDSTTTFYAKAADAAGNTSGCSTSNIAYVEDSTAPGLPTGLDVSPVSPANHNNPVISGSAEANATVKVYSDSGCSTLKGTGTASGIGAFGITVAVSDNTTTTFYAKAIDAAGNNGSCSTSNVVFVEDSTIPAVPTSLSVSPVSPANNNNITITGNTDPSMTVTLYTNNTCTSSVVGTGSSNGSGVFSIAVSVSDDTSTTFYATSKNLANNTSACSISNVTFVEDSTAPSVPASLAVAPTSPSPDNNPFVSGSTEANASVSVYTNSSCTSAVAGTGTANGSGSFSVAVSVAADSSSTFYAKSTDAAGNASSCSTSSVAYIEDSTAPGLPTGLDVTPTSPANNNAPSILGSAEANSTVRVYSDSGCSTLKGTGTATGLGTFSIAVAVSDNTSTTFYAKATDPAGNQGSCSTANIVFVEDSTAAAVPTSLAVSPTSPANNNNIAVSGSTDANASVALYTDSSCSSAVAGSGSANGSGAFSINIAVSDNTSTTYYGKATDVAGNTSACSVSNVTFVEDSAAPSAPGTIGVSPTSPANNNNPEVTGIAEANATVKVYTNSSCTSAVAATGAANGSGNFSIAVSVSADSSTTYYVTATDAAANASACSSVSVTYVEDSTAPGLPTSLDVTPLSPANNNNPTITGAAEANSSVSVYSDVSCSTLKGTGSANGTGAWSIGVAVGNNTTTTFYAKATDAAGNVGTCSSSNVTFVEDSSAPSQPAGLAVTPTSPANNNAPSVTGTAEANINIALYTDSGCTSAIAGSGTSTGGGTFSIAVSVTDNTSTTFYAKATDLSNNSSACSSSNVSFVEDSAAPAAPTGLASAPISPANENNPAITGSSEASASVSLYTNSTCTSGIFATASADGSGNFAIPAAVSNDTSTSFWAKATDLAGNAGPCSTSTITYVEDSTAPSRPTSLNTTPNAAANNNNGPSVTGGAEANSTVKVYSDSSCSTLKATGTANGSGLFSIAVAVGDDTTTSFYATSTDASNNPSLCSISTVTYVEDSSNPAAPSGLASSPTSPSNNNSPNITGNAEANSTVTVYSDPGCTVVMGTGTASGGGTFSIGVSVSADTSTTFYAKTVDAASNASVCSSSSIAYVEDSTVPANPTVATTSPVSPNPSNTPNVAGSAEVAATVDIYTNASCTSALAGTGTANGSGLYNISVTVGSDTTTSFYALVTDAAGNSSGCAGGLTYVEDSTAPIAPVSLAVTGGTRQNNNAPHITGIAEVASSVKLYTNNTCTSAVAGTATADITGVFDIATVVSDDTTTTFYATATDGAGNAGPCSTNYAVFEEDTTGPILPTGLAVTGGSPQNNNNPFVTGSTEANASVAIYSNPTCTSGVAGSGSANGSGNFSIQVSVSNDTTTTFYAKATDITGNSLGCSTSNIQFIEDSTAPATPNTFSSNPVPPINNNNPLLLGTAEAGSNVRIWTVSTCDSGLVNNGTATGGSFSIAATVVNDTSNNFYFNATDSSGNVSACSIAYNYVEDSTAPTSPGSLATLPNSPANNNNSPQITGTAETGSTVNIYTNGTCTSAIAGSAVASSGSFTASVAVLDDTTTTFYAKAVDAAGNASGCSGSNVTYVEDSTAPGLATALATTPVSPANNNNPSVSGSAEANMTVQLYTNGTCTSALAGSGTASAGGAFSIVVTVSDNSNQTYYAKVVDDAGNVSACSTANVAYVEDSLPPSIPSAMTTTPALAGNNNNAPTVNGSTDAGAFVYIYTNSSCTSAVEGSATANGGGTFNATVSVADNTTTTFWAKSADAAGNQSACSSSNITYVEDSSTPLAPSALATVPVSPANNNAPNVTGTAESGTTVRLYTNSSCTSGVLATGTAASGTFSIAIAPSDNTTTDIWATSQDAAGNTSGCSISTVSYVEDSAAPAAPTVSSITPTHAAVTPDGIGNNNNPVVTGTSEVGATVRIYTNGTCTTLVGTDVAGVGGVFNVTTAVSNNTTSTMYARATDAAGNLGPCSTTFKTYTEDSNAPAVLALTGVTPVSPNDDHTPTFTGTAEANALVKLYTDSLCTNYLAENTTDLNATAFSVTIPALADDEVMQVWGTPTDRAGNTGPCSQTHATSTSRDETYVHFSIPEGVGYFEGTRTVGNANLNSSATPSAFQWSTNTTKKHSTYYTHSISTNSHLVRVNIAGDYLVSLNMVITNTTGIVPVAVGFQVRTGNGTTQTDHPRGQCIARHSTPAANTTRTSSCNATVLLSLAADDYIDVTAFRVGSGTTSTTSPGSSMYIKYIPNTAKAYLAQATTNTNAGSTNYNANGTEYYFRWQDVTTDAAFTHSDSTNPEQVTLTEAGTYFVSVVSPTSAQSNHGNMRYKVYGGASGATLQPGAEFKQGFGGTATSYNNTASWMGIIDNVTANDVVRVSMQQEANNTGTITAIASRQASFYIEKVDTTCMYFGVGTTSTGTTSTEYNQTGSLKFSTDYVIDTACYTHSESTNNHQITVTDAGDYELTFSAAVTGATADANFSATVQVNGSNQARLTTSSFYIEVLGAGSTHAESSGTMMVLVKDVPAGANITVATATITAGSFTASSGTGGGHTLMIKKLTRATTP